jgi:contactin associated protein-like 2
LGTSVPGQAHFPVGIPGWAHILIFSLSLLETGKIDQEIHRYNTPGFTGCLSRVQFNHIAPLKAALRQTNASAHVHIQGELVESNCGASPLTLSPMSSATDPWHLDHLDSGKVQNHLGPLFYLNLSFLICKMG